MKWDWVDWLMVLGIVLAVGAVVMSLFGVAAYEMGWVK